MSGLTRDGTAEPVSRDQIIRRGREQGNIHFPCSADHEQDFQPYPVDPQYSAIYEDDHRYIFLAFNTVTAGKCNWRHSGWSARLVGFPQCYLTCRFLTNKIFYLIQVWVVFQNEREEG